MFQFLFDGQRGGNSGQPKTAHHRTLLRIEGLEDRCTPANFVVNTTADTVDVNPGDGLALDAFGNTSLRAAIMEGNSFNGLHNITFSFPGAENDQDTTITLFTALPALERTYIIDGQVSGGTPPPGGGGGGPVVIVADEPGGGGTTLPPPPPGTYGVTVTIARSATAANFRLFTVDPPAGTQRSLTLSNLALTGGKSVGSPGGAVYVVGELSMTRCTVTNNSSDGVGGAVAVLGRITVSGCDFRSNSGGSGGALRFAKDSAQPSTISGSRFQNNQTSASGGAISYWHLGGEGTFEISGTRIVNNKSIANNVNVSANGGGIEVIGSMTFTGGEISGNETTGSGGGFYVSGNNSKVAFNGLILSDNKCNLRGGAFYVASGTVAITSPLSFTGNTGMVGFEGGVWQAPGFAQLFGAPLGSQTVVEHK